MFAAQSAWSMIETEDFDDFIIEEPVFRQDHHRIPYTRTADQQFQIVMEVELNAYAALYVNRGEPMRQAQALQQAA